MVRDEVDRERMGLQLERERLERGAEREKLDRRLVDEESRSPGLASDIKRMKAVEADQRLERSTGLRLFIDRSHELEVKLGRLMEENSRLEEGLTEARLEVSRRSQVDKLEWERKAGELKFRSKGLEGENEIIKGELGRMKGEVGGLKSTLVENQSLRGELLRAKAQVERL